MGGRLSRARRDGGPSTKKSKADEDATWATTKTRPPLPLLRLSPELRREVLGFLVSASEDFAVRRLEEAYAASGKVSTASAVSVLIYHTRTTRWTCRALRRDVEVMETSRSSDLFAPACSPKSWLWHLYETKSYGDREEALAELNCRAKTGRRANVCADVADRRRDGGIRRPRGDAPADAFDFRLRCPASWSPRRRENAQHELTAYANDHLASDPGVLAYATVRTLQEEHGALPGDRALLEEVRVSCLDAMVQGLARRSWTAHVWRVDLLYRGTREDGRCDRAAGQAEDLVRKFFGARVMGDADTWVQRYTNCTPISYREWAEEHEDGAESDDDEYRRHDSSRAPLGSWRRAFDRSWDVPEAPLDLPLTEFCDDQDRCLRACRLRVRLAFDGEHSPQIDEEDGEIFRFLDLESIHGPAGEPLGDACYKVHTKVRRPPGGAEDQERLDHGICLITLNDKFTLMMHCYVPGLN